MRICIVYDCLYPHTVGGAERWYRELAQRLAEDGHEVTYVTMRQWQRGERAQIDPRVRVVTAAPRMALYTREGRRRILPPLVFGLGVLAHLLRARRSYEVVHTCSFPYFPLLAAAAVRPLGRYGLVVDWFEVWSRSYWRDYLGGLQGWIGALVQRLCVRVPQRAFCFSELHLRRLEEEGLVGPRAVLRGLSVGSQAHSAIAAEQLVVFAGRLIPEKRTLLGVAAVALATPRVPGLRAVFYGDGPEREALQRAIVEHGLSETVQAPGFAESELLEQDMRRALCVLLPSRREGYGLVVVEASAHATPAVVVAGEDNAAVELVEDGVNGVIAVDDAPETVAQAIVRVHELGMALRESTAQWYAQHAQELSLESSLAAVLASYRGGGAQPQGTGALGKPNARA
ncbi:MAG TPA: glycosyltransferase [Solirubrobacteraceae bacterium]|jgi:glycosyltransferase involved in cell wall biosynthesis